MKFGKTETNILYQVIFFYIINRVFLQYFCNCDLIRSEYFVTVFLVMKHTYISSTIATKIRRIITSFFAAILLISHIGSSIFVSSPASHAASSQSHPSNTKFLQLVVYSNFACGLRDDSTVWCWGSNNDL